LNLRSTAVALIAAIITISAVALISAIITIPAIALITSIITISAIVTIPAIVAIIALFLAVAISHEKASRDSQHYSEDQDHAEIPGDRSHI
jgi:uncharacterized membrane protein